MKQAIYLPHGAGPLPLLGDPSQQPIVTLFEELGPLFEDSSAIVLITAHWEAEQVSLSSAGQPGMLYDYYGFPPQAYDIQYPAPGAPDLAAMVQTGLASYGFGAVLDDERDFDHGTFVPMKLIRPNADIPILQMSLLGSLDPKAHLAIGQALGHILADDVSIIGSGLSFHNIPALRSRDTNAISAAVAFDDWLNDTLAGPVHDKDRILTELGAWADAPGARLCHPREEHLLPLHVCAGAGLAAGFTMKNIFREKLMGFPTSGFHWH